MWHSLEKFAALQIDHIRWPSIIDNVLQSSRPDRWYYTEGHLEGKGEIYNHWWREGEIDEQKRRDIGTGGLTISYRIQRVGQLTQKSEHYKWRKKISIVMVGRDADSSLTGLPFTNTESTKGHIQWCQWISGWCALNTKVSQRQNVKYNNIRLTEALGDTTLIQDVHRFFVLRMPWL